MPYYLCIVMNVLSLASCRVKRDREIGAHGLLPFSQVVISILTELSL